MTLHEPFEPHGVIRNLDQSHELVI